MKGTFLISLLSTCVSLSAATPMWPQFRGPNSSGIGHHEKPPVQFGPETNLLWKVDAPSGLSSPCIVGDRIFVTAFDDGKLLALCYDRNNGKELWRREAPAGKPQEVHQVSSPAVATPVADEQAAYFYFVPFGLIAYDHEGKERWRKAVPLSFVMNGSGTSPALSGDTLILNCDQDEADSFVLAVNAHDGKTRWQTSRAGSPGSYTTPITWKHGEAEDVVVCGSLRVTGYDMKSGAERWFARVLTSVSVSATPVVGANQLYVMSRGVPPNAMGTFEDFMTKNDKNSDGKIAKPEAPAMFQGSMFRVMDRNNDGFITQQDWTTMTNFFTQGDSGLFAVRAPGKGDITSTHVAWKQTKGIAGISSPLFYENRIYAVQDGGRVTCWNATTGDTLYLQERLGEEGEYYASPIAANGNVYLTSSRGTVTAIRASDAFEVIARNKVGDSVMSTPAIAADKIYIRSAKHLWAFGTEK